MSKLRKSELWSNHSSFYSLLLLQDSEASLGTKSQPKRHLQCTSLARWHGNTSSWWHRRCASLDITKNRWNHSKHCRGHRPSSRTHLQIQTSNWEEACSRGCPRCPSGQHLHTFPPSDYQPIGWHEENRDYPWWKLHQDFEVSPQNIIKLPFLMRASCLDSIPFATCTAVHYLNNMVWQVLCICKNSLKGWNISWCTVAVEDAWIRTVGNIRL
jgi:hypothetical protein